MGAALWLDAVPRGHQGPHVWLNHVSAANVSASMAGFDSLCFWVIWALPVSLEDSMDEQRKYAPPHTR